MRWLIAVALVACSSPPKPGGQIVLTGSTNDTFTPDPAGILTCEPTYVMTRYASGPEILIITIYPTQARANGIRVELDNSHHTYGLDGSAKLATETFDGGTAYTVTFDPSVSFQVSEYAKANPHQDGGSDRVVHASGAITIVCKK
jgi:hypothetical protein